MINIKIALFILINVNGLEKLETRTLRPRIPPLKTVNREALKAMMGSSFMEGDIVARKQLSGKTQILKAGLTTFQSAVPRDELRWPGGIIPFVIAENVTMVPLILKAMHHIEKFTCIKFRSKKPEDYFYLEIFKGQGCYASIGMDVDFPKGVVSLGDGCEFMGTVLHELMHTIGFYHEHNRHNRDKFLKINWHNIDEKHHSQFRLLAANQGRIMSAFDYNSIMLYGPRAFSKNLINLTMEPVLENFYMLEIYEKPSLTQLDAEAINKLYKCSKKQPK